uniref:Small ribosomal subunit protein uS3c n=1 Tax=Erodium absinthoides TaxID=337345 RepID=A0A0D3M029_9ROSI|nr:ribosomal protein S3 [Erodium absinthoides]AIA26398.1 ribosomal protein S3 [Erodium absinthoides]
MGQKINPLGFRLGTTQEHHSIWFEQPKEYCEGLQEDQKIRDCIQNFIDNRRRRFPPTIELISRIQIEKGTDLVHVIIYMGFPSWPKEKKPRKRKKKQSNRLKEKEIKELKIKKIEEWERETEIKKLKEKVEKALHGGKRKFHLKENVKLQVLRDGKLNLKENVEKVLHGEKRKLKISIFALENPDGDPTILAAFFANQLKSRIPFRKAMQQTMKRAEEEGRARGIQVQLAGRIEGKEIARVEWLRKGRVSLQTIRTKIDFCSTTVRTIHGVLGIKIWLFGMEAKRKP